MGLIVQGSYILLSPYALHRQPDLFPEPDAFKPERFLEGGSAAALPRFQYIPFGGGGRSCIGSTFAMYEMKQATGAGAAPDLPPPPAAHPWQQQAGGAGATGPRRSRRSVAARPT
ncbi:cytochrome P450 [Haematococcus lacustris]|uniref:Cytochrome P450 n=1 Tax=Haematococcus lacustris TaxID=44745 RepID=A0A699YUE3_HAELA|nr:cytochrome P450 [Haematococcus lacustris]